MSASCSGLRAEALSPVSGSLPPEGGDNILRGTIRYVEHHGHESLAFLDIGATAVTVDDLWTGPEPDPGSPRRRFGAMLRQLTGRAIPLSVGAGRAHTDAPTLVTANPAAPPSVFGDSRRHRRPAEFVVRLAPYPGGSAGQAIAVAVRLDQAHFFDGRGDRIDVGWR